MIRLEDVYKVVSAMVPLYVALGLGYGSVKWRGMFKPDQCDAINRFNCYFIMPFFGFQFTSRIDPYHMNYRFLAGDVVAKAIAGAALALWANLWRKGNFSWAITSFSLSSLNNTLVVGVPLLKAMYGPVGEDLVVQSSVIQALLWFPLLLFLLEFRRTRNINNNNINPTQQQQQQQLQQVCSIEIMEAGVDHAKHERLQENDHDQTNTSSINPNINGTATSTEISSSVTSSYNCGSTMKKVWAKLATNPNAYACALGLVWALLAKRWNFEMPSIVGDSIMIMAKAGSGVAMFTMGLFMALQDKMIACGVRLTIYGMALRFVCGPLATAVGSLALGLRSNVLRIVIIQAALPQAIASFVFAQEYGLHADVLSTAVIFGTIASLPLLIAYYVILDVLR